MSASEPLRVRSRRGLPLPSGRTLKIAVFAIAILVLGVEQLVFFTGSSGTQGSATVHARHAYPRTFAGQVAAQVDAALGPSDRGVRRFTLRGMAADPRRPGMRRVSVIWAINGDLSLGSVSDEAHLEVYLVMRGLFTSRQPIAFARMTGTFGRRDAHGRAQEVRVLDVGLDRAVARLIEWDTVDPSTLWPLLHRYWERPGFECNCQA